MKNKFQLFIKTPDQEIFAGEATAIRFAADDGVMKVYAKHASITATATFSPVVVEIEGTTEEFLIRQGVFCFNNQTNSATLLALYCQERSQISQEATKDYLAFIEDQISQGKDLSEFQLVYLQDEKFAVEKQLKSI